MSIVLRKALPYGIGMILYLACSQLFAYASAREGLVSPTGTPHFGVLLLGIASIVARVTVLFVLPFIGVFQLLGHMRNLGTKRQEP